MTIVLVLQPSFGQLSLTGLLILLPLWWTMCALGYGLLRREYRRSMNADAWFSRRFAVPWTPFQIRLGVQSTAAGFRVEAREVAARRVRRSIVVLVAGEEAAEVFPKRDGIVAFVRPGDTADEMKAIIEQAASVAA